VELWERFSGYARRAVLLAHDEAMQAKQQRIGTEHMLLGILRLGEGSAVDVLRGLDVALDSLRGEICRQTQDAAEREPTSEIAFTADAQKVLQHAYNEAKNMGQTYIGTEHLLVGLVRQEPGLAHRVLERHGVDLRTCRQAIQNHATAPEGKPEKAKKRDDLAAGLTDLRRGVDRLERGLRGLETERTAREEFGRAVTELAQEGNLDALVLVIGREGLESCLSTKPRHLRELIAYVKRLLEEEGERREADEQRRDGEPQEDAPK
jgi:ATP-dependent Clp protease ATP-binding subunit ClpC